MLAATALLWPLAFAPGAGELEHGVVIDAKVEAGRGALANEPITRATIRDGAGHTRVVRVVGGPNASGGTTRIAGLVVPVLGQRVRLDLREERAPASPPLLWAPNMPSGTWADSSLPVAFTPALPLSRDLGAREVSELDVALRTWPRVACTRYRTRHPLAASQVAAGDDGVNVVLWHDDLWPAELIPDVLGQTVVHTDASGRLHDADIHLNGADYRWSADGAPGTIDARSVLTHELGHALGLGHSSDPRATMCASGASDLSWRSLEKDDEDGVCALYPGQGDPGCDSDACPEGFVCVARACESRGAKGELCSPCVRVPGACDGSGDRARCIDIGAGAAAGRVCGRPCATEADCGPRFHCLPTTSSGDVQCVPDDGCASGPDPCAIDADCKDSSCRGGACVGAPPPAPDAGGGADAEPDSSGPAPVGAGGGCETAKTRATPEETILFVASFFWLVSRKPRRSRASSARRAPRPSSSRRGRR